MYAKGNIQTRRFRIEDPNSLRIVSPSVQTLYKGEDPHATDSAKKFEAHHENKIDHQLLHDK